ncbi:MAG: hypothetical protein ABSE43_09340 [Steroidobacteraceae bacterium]|jgi:hypothetical protein
MDPKLSTLRAGPGPALAIALCATLCSSLAGTAHADVSLPAVSVGAGIQTGFYSCTNACIYSPGEIPAGDSTVDGFALDSIRLYLNGSVTDQIKMTFNTEYTGSGTDKVEVLDAIGRFEFSDAVNIWVGRFLPPSDRANLYGPYYANDWTPFADGVADYYPDVAVGRDNGAAYWGDFGMLKVQAGVFDGQSLGGSTAVADSSKLLYAGRVTLDFWDKEKGYYLNGTYYGDKDILALGIAAQSQDSKTAFNLDGLMEKKLAGAGVIGVEAEYQKDNGLVSNGFDDASSDGWYGLVSFLFAQQVGYGKFQVLDKYSEKTYDATALTDSTKIKTNEVDINYIIKEFNARVGAYYVTQTDSALYASSPKEFGIKLQLQM